MWPFAHYNGSFGRNGSRLSENLQFWVKALKSKNKKSDIGAQPKAKPVAAKSRLDELLVAKGLAPTLSEARALIMAGKVVVGDQRQDKPGYKVPPGESVRIKQESRFVSRGGEKLWAAVHDLGVEREFQEKVVLDVGASTGGFTHCCLELGAKAVISLDVGVAQLAWQLRQDPRVTVLERTDLRLFEAQEHPPIDWVVADISFNSLGKLAGALRKAAPRAGTGFLLLIKPQFELPKGAVPKGGVVTDEAQRLAAIESASRALDAVGLVESRVVPSRVHGRSGNLEFFFYARPATDYRSAVE
ncbi:TlyA family rRNA (cytidine-2'-O)-methyltransferase [Planctomyces bekefii]|uniref:TlyA family rRNA (Cytidine-2'-O)-methyltransferase n=1 Tax=Planctomyces bekefii TaxID=1653850 RepID=A0A5C6M733_9PLAN|nr:TlyA family rRNA (cytidine-2'-O)-methyltransferase [Planctomyces bekefii]